MQADEGNQYCISCPIRQCKQPPTDISKNSHISLLYSILGQLHMLCSNCIFHLLSSMAPICTIVKITFSHSSEYFLFTSSNSSRAATERRVRCESLSRQACAQPRNDQIEQQCDSYYMAAEEKEVEGTQCFHVTFHRGVH